MLARSLIGIAALLLVASSAAVAADGAAVFKAQCAKCHGDTGNSDTTIGKAMKVPPLAGDANDPEDVGGRRRRRASRATPSIRRPSSR